MPVTRESTPQFLSSVPPPTLFFEKDGAPAQLFSSGGFGEPILCASRSRIGEQPETPL